MGNGPEHGAVHRGRGRGLDSGAVRASGRRTAGAGGPAAGRADSRALRRGQAAARAGRRDGPGRPGAAAGPGRAPGDRRGAGHDHDRGGARGAGRAAGGHPGADADHRGRRPGHRRALPAGQLRRGAVPRRAHVRRGARPPARGAGADARARRSALARGAQRRRARAASRPAGRLGGRAGRLRHHELPRPPGPRRPRGPPVDADGEARGHRRPAAHLVRRTGLHGHGARRGTRAADDFEALLAAEERAGRTDPYRAVAALLHLCGVRG
ncbi:hypothetical protein STENM36S_07318 [Streptomyces tendae]